MPMIMLMIIGFIVLIGIILTIDAYMGRNKKKTPITKHTTNDTPHHHHKKNHDDDKQHPYNEQENKPTYHNIIPTLLTKKYVIITIIALVIMAILWRLGLGPWALSSISIIPLWLLRHVGWLRFLWPLIRFFRKK